MTLIDNLSERAADLSRRNFLRAGAVAGGGLLLSVGLPFASRESEAAASDGFAPNAFVRIGSDGKVVLTMPYVEMGQGTYTSIPMLIAEELEIGLTQVRLEHAPPSDKLYANPLLGVQATGNSNAMRGAWQPMRKAGATAKAMLVAAAAKRWNVEPGTCRAENGEVHHAASGRKLGYGELATDAAQMPVPENVTLKSPSEFKLIGTPAKRLDTPSKINGTAVYGIDARPPGVKIATLAQSPVFGGRVKRVDDAAAKAVKGVRQIVTLDDAVAVVADHMGAAKKGLAALTIEWDEGPHAKLATADIARELEAATTKPGTIAQNIGDADKAMAGAATKVEATYQLPFLAHATMEPMNCTVHVRPDGCEIWVGSQALSRAQAVAAKVLNMPPEKVVVHNHLLGGGFGRRLEVDGVIRAVQIAKQVDAPVKLVWTREEDIQHDMYRPYWCDRISVGLDASGKPVAWNNRFAGSSVLARWAPPAFRNGLDPDTTEGAIDLVYDIPNFHVEYVRVEPPGIPTAFWRSVGPSHNVFVTESVIDELAAAAKQDPVDYRRALLGKSPRAKAALELAAAKAGWGGKLPAGRGRGVSLQFVFGSYLAQIAEVEVARDGSVRVHRVVCAMDCGTVVNPDTVQAQLQSGINFGVTAALYGEITLKDGRVEQSNFDSYQMLRIDQAPAIEVHIVPSTEPPGGMGETGTSGIVPAISNAIFAATGKRLRKMPVDPAALKQT
ncbi:MULTISPECIES: xanthine dehydrogenase family protein molybdopterin-binding subunit [Bradyrhizobium]|jgi:isoquinoline 1-oxidoreductase subunit beta|uniref:xanthine dehydrogenase family protein molybdopterin-binding subunit n=1 Tax=Bradyrhizobium TaxID=374 RepID=UPI0004B37F65|nr:MULTISPECIES: xanthine dehydrogenase family protein molybdopterin-binding subunit [Bradyrhizobium]MCS3450533.1 isoquinoline 1-oxidoreductase beta subunit [Bradyrhizobium elkanii]MCS3558322.1 isoquinoline 1-oxidoreductase beta subunit [Bradyrhizobium elkanii]MCW2151831.1 isoquinoline 1-oxidoreductase beta subunit [Bradyrhizobium elkanii]MCW2358296.1 isoquinoline 1-oxidoreductase beta subunit [Bradyrhizobium elkanii]MCW2375562.1 isoquinoline 1-oxidoreductase beta subunit [Bradyrhizobium elkan